MNKWKVFLGILIISFLLVMTTNYFTSTTKTMFNAVVVNNRYSVDVPDYMTKTTNLNSADFQYYNEPLRSFITIEKKSKILLNGRSVKAFYEYLINEYKLSLKDCIVNEEKEYEINGMKTYRAKFQGFFIDKTLYYNTLVIDGNNDVYMFTIWTSIENNKKHNDDIELLINSFKEID